MLTKLLASRPAAVVSRYILAAERRLWFGANRLKNRYTQEVLVLASKRSGLAAPLD
jgi:hypothetical protein